MKRKSAFLTVMAVVTLVAAVSQAGQKRVPWKAPESAVGIKNPVGASEENVQKGQEIYSRQCVPCHGEQGRGDGPAGKYLGTALPDFTSPEMSKQSDGELFWKITNGKAPMPTFKEILSDEERWLVTNYVRTFGAEEYSSNQ